MPELPEVEALVQYLRGELSGAVVAEIELASFAVLKTYDPPLAAFAGLEVTDVSRHGKFIDLDVDGLHLIIHLSKAGWVRWSEKFTDRRLKMGNGPIALRFRVDRGGGPIAGFDVTEAGTRKGLSVYAVRDPLDVPGVAALGPDPLSAGFDVLPLLARRMQVKRLLRDQKIIAGIGNAYSDEILHEAKVSPFAIAESLSDLEQRSLAAAIRLVLSEALEGASGRPASELKDSKRQRMRVHGRTGQACDVCGSAIAEVSFADSSMQYCPGCQTNGTVLKNRSTSKFLK